MGARSDLRHDAAESGVLVHLRENDVRQDTATAVSGAFHYRSRGFVAGGFDPEDDHGSYMPLSSFRDAATAAGPESIRRSAAGYRSGLARSARAPE